MTAVLVFKEILKPYALVSTVAEKPLDQIRTGSGWDLGYFLKKVSDFYITLTPILYQFFHLTTPLFLDMIKQMGS